MVNVQKNNQSQAEIGNVVDSEGLPAKFEIGWYTSESSTEIMMELENEVYFLKEEIIRLKEENEGLQQDRELAGELGKSLLENNQELERKLEEVNTDYISTLGKIEVS